MTRRLVITLASLAVLLGAVPAVAVAGPHIEMAVDGQGRTVAGIGPGPKGRTAIVRLDAAGRLDPSFAGDGTIGPFRSKGAAAISVARDGDVVVADEPQEGLRVLRRYRAADGKPDPHFGHGGYAAIPVVPKDRVFVQPDGHVVVLYQMECPSTSCGYLLTYLKMVRYNPRGRVEGVHTMYQEEWQYESAAMDPRGSLVVKGSDEEIGWQTFVRFRPDGRVDPGVGGKDGLNIEPPPFEEGAAEGPSSKQEEVPRASHMALAPDGGILLTNEGFGGGDAAVGRRKPTGYLDRKFGVDGQALCKPEGEAAERQREPFDAIAAAADGSILAAGGFGSCGLVRYTASGVLDPSFGDDGRVDLEALGLARATTMSLAPGGEVVVGGWDPTAGAVEFARFTSDGHLDPSFGDAGVTSVAGF